MTMLRTALVCVLAGLLLPGSSAAKVTRAITVPVTVEGSVQATFHADAATGCRNPCGLSGSLTWSPGRSALLSAYEERHGRSRKLEGSLAFIFSPLEAGTSTTAHVTVEGAPGAPVCSDVQSRLITVIDFSAGARAHLNAGLAGGSTFSPGIFQTRCGGPLDGDLASALAVQPIDRGTLRRGRTTVDLTGTRSFAANGLAGSVESSVKLHLGAPFPPFDLRPPKRRSARTRREPRMLSATYRIERVSGTVATGFAGGSESLLCAPLGVCGASGTARVTPLVSSGTATFLAFAGSSRTTHAQLRAALGLAPGRRVHGVSILGRADWSRDEGAVTETYSGAGGTCADSVPLDSGRLDFTFGRRRVFVSYGRGDGYEEPPFRTRCPGPSLIDVAQDHPLATGQVPLRAFRHRRVVIQLARTRRFESQPYAGETRAALTVVLRRGRVSRGSEGGDALIIRRARQAESG